MIIRDWFAKRAGGAITIDGVNVETGMPVKLTGVSHINGPRLRNGEHRTLAYQGSETHELRAE